MIVNWNCTLPENEGMRIKVDIVRVCKKKYAMALVMSINFSNTCFLQVSCKSVLSFTFTTCHRHEPLTDFTGTISSKSTQPRMSDT